MKQTEFYTCWKLDNVVYKVKRQGYTRTFLDYKGKEFSLHCYRNNGLWLVVEHETGLAITSPQKKRDFAFELGFSTMNQWAKHKNKSVEDLLQDLKRVKNYEEYKGENENE